MDSPDRLSVTLVHPMNKCGPVTRSYSNFEGNIRHSSVERPRNMPQWMEYDAIYRPGNESQSQCASCSVYFVAEFENHDI